MSKPLERFLDNLQLSFDRFQLSVFGALKTTEVDIRYPKDDWRNDHRWEVTHKVRKIGPDSYVSFFDTKILSGEKAGFRLIQQFDPGQETITETTFDANGRKVEEAEYRKGMGLGPQIGTLKDVLGYLAEDRAQLAENAARAAQGEFPGTRMIRVQPGAVLAAKVMQVVGLSTRSAKNPSI